MRSPMRHLNFFLALMILSSVARAVSIDQDIVFNAVITSNGTKITVWNQDTSPEEYSCMSTCTISLTSPVDITDEVADFCQADINNLTHNLNTCNNQLYNISETKSLCSLEFIELINQSCDPAYMTSKLENRTNKLFDEKFLNIMQYLDVTILPSREELDECKATLLQREDTIHNLEAQASVSQERLEYCQSEGSSHSFNEMFLASGWIVAIIALIYFVFPEHAKPLSGSKHIPSTVKKVEKSHGGGTNEK